MKCHLWEILSEIKTFLILRFSGPLSLLCVKFVYVKNILSCVKQEIDMWQIGNCVTARIQLSILMDCAKYQEAFLCG